MDSINQAAYIIDIFDPYNTKANEDIMHKFQLYGRWYGIYKVALEWGKPLLKNRPIDEDDSYLSFHIYDTLEEAKAFARQLRNLEGSKF